MSLSRKLCLSISLALLMPVVAAAQQPDPPVVPAPDAPPVTPPVAPTPTPQPPPEVEPPVTTPVNDDIGTELRDDDDSGKHGKKKKKKKHDPVEYEPRRGITVRSGKTSIRIFMGIETVFLYGHCFGDSFAEKGEGCKATDLATTHVRRARLAFEAKLKHHLTIDIGVQVKNEIIVLKNANLAWKKNHLTLKAGFLKPPGGIERDSSTWVKAFPERSVVANFHLDRIIGLMVSKWSADHTMRFQAAAGRAPAGNFDAFEPEDAVVPPPGIEAEDLTTDPANWETFATFTYVPSPTFEIGINTRAHIAPDAGQGPSYAEPYETKVLPAVFFKGVYVGGGADVSWHGSKVRASAEVVGFLLGNTIPHTDTGLVGGAPIEATRGKRGYAGYTVLGFTPNGEYGPAIENSPLLKGYQFLVRGEFLSASPGAGLDGNSTALFGSGTVGVEWQVSPQLRLQFDTALQHFNEDVAPNNHNVWRSYTELWAQVLL